jgi:tetratricopeptide (TPR) repeat protein
MSHMGNKSTINRAIGLVSALILLSGLIYGCYSREAVPEKKIIYGQDIKPNPLSEEELRKFAGTIRPVDGEAEAHYQLALHFQQKNRHKLAIDELRLVLQRSPAHAKAYNALGVSYDNLGDHEAAIESYQIALKLDSKLDYVYNNLGYSYLLNGQTAEAVGAFQQAISIKATEKRYRNNLGLAYTKQERYDLAFEQFRALDTSAGAEKTFAKVMSDLGKSDQTGNVLAAIKPAAEAQANVSEPAHEMPDLAQASDTLPANDPIARFQALAGSMGKSSSTAPPAAFESPPHKEGSPSPTVAQALLDEKPKAPAAVVQIPAPPASLESPYEIKVAAAAPPEPAPPVAQEAVNQYPIAAVALADSTPRVKQPATPMRSPYVNAVQKEMRAIEPPQVMLAQPVESESAEIREERILMAASSTRAAGWQNAPEPKATAERGIVEIEVANGNGVKGSAGKVAEHLRRNGFKVVRVLDAQSHDHFSTKVFYYGGNLKEAQRLLKAIPEIASDAELYELESMGSHIRLLIGKDLIERNKTLTWDKPRSMSTRIGG